MRDGAEPAGRRPGAVADDDGGGLDGIGPDPLGADVRWGVDTDTDGRPDTLLTADGADLLVLTDLDDDGLADRVLRLGPDGSVYRAGPPEPSAGFDAHRGHPDREDPDSEGPDSGSPDPGPDPASVPGPWSVLLSRLIGLGP